MIKMKITIVVIALVLVTIGALYLLSGYKHSIEDEEIFSGEVVSKEESIQKPLSNPSPQGPPDRSEYVKEANRNALWHKKQHEMRKKIVVTPGMKEAIKKRMAPFVKLSEKLLRDIEFYGRVVDQYENGVPDLLVRYSGTRSTFVPGSGYGDTITDSNGYFSIIDAKGKSLYLYEASKVGYEFPKEQYLKAEEWAPHDANNPYIINAWKVEKYPKVKSDSPFLGFIPDGRIYTIDFSRNSNNKIKFDGRTDGDLIVRAIQDSDTWVFELEAVDGGIQETEDIYRYSAPVDGYKKNLVLRGDSTQRRVDKSIYFSSRNSGSYGTVKMEIRPSYRNQIAVVFDYVVNLEQGRNLTVKK